MNKIFKIINDFNNEVEIINEFKYNDKKRVNFIRDSIASIIHYSINNYEKDSTYYIFVDNLLSKGYSLVRISKVIKNYKFDNNLLKIFKKIDTSNILYEINKTCKITESEVNNINSLDEINNLIEEFICIKYHNKPSILINLYKKKKN